MLYVERYHARSEAWYVGNLSRIIEIPAFGAIMFFPTGRCLETRVVLRQFQTTVPQKCCSPAFGPPGMARRPEKLTGRSFSARLKAWTQKRRRSAVFLTALTTLAACFLVSRPLHDLGQRQPSDLRTSRDKSVRYRPDRRSSIISVPQRHLAWSPGDPRCLHFSRREHHAGSGGQRDGPAKPGGFADRRLYQVVANGE